MQYHTEIKVVIHLTASYEITREFFFLFIKIFNQSKS